MSDYFDHTKFNVKLVPAVKEEWLKRLRSGNYQQTKGALKQLLTGIVSDGSAVFGYCCLGVLGDMYVDENKGKDNPNPRIKWGSPALGNGTCPLFTEDSDNDGMPTFDVVHWAFHKYSNNGWHVYIDEADAEKYKELLAAGNNNSIFLPSTNDSGVPFADIADIIEKYL